MIKGSDSLIRHKTQKKHLCFSQNNASSYNSKNINIFIQINKKSNNFKKAEEHTNLFLEIGKSKNHIKKEAYLLLYKTYEQQNKHKKALEYHTLSSEIDSQLSQEILNKISDIKLLKNQSEQDLLLKQK